MYLSSDSHSDGHLDSSGPDFHKVKLALGAFDDFYHLLSLKVIPDKPENLTEEILIKIE